MFKWFKRYKDEVNIKKLIDANNEDKLNLLKSEFEMSTFFDITPAFLGIATTEKFTKISTHFSKSLGYTKEEILSTPFLSLIHPDDIQSTINIIKYAQAGNVIINYENRYLKKDSGYILIRWQATLIDGIFYVAGSDVTKENELINTIKVNEEKFRKLFEDSNIPMCIFDRELFEFSDVNNSFCEKLGYTKEELPNFKDLIHPDDYSSSISATKEARKNPTKNFQHNNRYIAKDGTIKTISWESSKLPDRFVYCTAKFKK